MTSRHSRPALQAARLRGVRAALPWLLALACLWGQAMGQWHRIAHGSHGSVLTDPQATASIDAPFGHDAGDSASCQTFDHLALADLLSFTPPALPLQAVQEGVMPVPAEGLVDVRVREWRARGPPRA